MSISRLVNSRRHRGEWGITPCTSILQSWLLTPSPQTKASRGQASDADACPSINLWFPVTGLERASCDECSKRTSTFKAGSNTWDTQFKHIVTINPIEQAKYVHRPLLDASSSHSRMPCRFKWRYPMGRHFPWMLGSCVFVLSTDCFLPSERYVSLFLCVVFFPIEPVPCALGDRIPLGACPVPACRAEQENNCQFLKQTPTFGFPPPFVWAWELPSNRKTAKGGLACCRVRYCLLWSQASGAERRVHRGNGGQASTLQQFTPEARTTITIT